VTAPPEKHRSLLDRLRRVGVSQNSNAAHGRWRLFTSSDQSAIALLAFLAIAGMAASWVISGGLSGGLVDIDEASPLNASFQTDINTADWTELMQLPEIGETMARRIVESRQQQGPFKSREDLQRVRGIGPRTMEKIRPYLRPVHEAPPH